MSVLDLQCLFYGLPLLFLCVQLTHCSKPVMDLLMIVIKSMDMDANKHLSHLVSMLDPMSHSELVSSSTLTTLVSALFVFFFCHYAGLCVCFFSQQIGLLCY